LKHSVLLKANCHKGFQGSLFFRFYYKRFTHANFFFNIFPFNQSTSQHFTMVKPRLHANPPKTALAFRDFVVKCFAGSDGAGESDPSISPVPGHPSMELNP